MEDFSLVEADFQQHYNIDLEQMTTKMNSAGIGFLRYSRLFLNLPRDCRIMRKLNPAGSWMWNDEVQSRMLRELSVISTTLYNTKRKKGQKALTPDKQFQPDYIDIAKKEYEKTLEKKKVIEQDKRDLELFFAARNPEVRQL